MEILRGRELDAKIVKGGFGYTSYKNPKPL